LLRSLFADDSLVGIELSSAPISTQTVDDSTAHVGRSGPSNFGETMRLLFLLAPLSLLCGCSNGLNSKEEAEMAYLGLDSALGKAMSLGFAGFNAANSANIPQQETTGDISGSLIVNGQVDQGTSDNKGMRLDLTMHEYSDFVDLDSDGDREISVTYWTEPHLGLPSYDLQLHDIPDGVFDGSLDGSFVMEGDIEGNVMLSVTLAGRLESNGEGGTRSEAGSTTIVGTATGPSGYRYDIDLSI
jgi:hypothetical protein